LTIRPGGQSETAFAHTGEDFLTIVAGRLHISVDGLGEFDMGEGDSLHFDSSLSHSWSNTTEETATVVWAQLTGGPRASTPKGTT
jgi:mannose-6-phosphate isomerase-like protein (cupin superfamily)